MKIVLTGGGTGGHFYPLIAVAEEIQEIAKEKKIVQPEIFFLAPSPYSESILFQHQITFKEVPAGKIRRYFSIKNIKDFFTTVKGCFRALSILFKIYPDVIFSKGAYGSFPTLFIGRLLRIPIVVHESDSRPGKVNQWSGKFAKRIAVSYPSATKYFKKDKVAWTGNPIRKELMMPIKEGAFERFGLNKDIPVILVLGGSQGAQSINDALIDTLPFLLDKYQILHQTGPKNFEAVRSHTKVTLEKNEFKSRYKPFPYFDEMEMRMAVGATSLVLSRAGSTIFEIASWGLPSIIIPIGEKVSHDQRSNAYQYAENGACLVIEDENLRPEIITAQINKIMGSPELQQQMKDGAKKFARNDSARVIAEEVMEIGLTHE